MKEYLIKLEETGGRHVFRDPEDLGKRSKPGGGPTWIQNDETPTCPR